MRRIALALCLSLTAHLVGQTAYTVRSNGNDHLYRIDLSTGKAMDLGLVGFSDAEGVSFGPNLKIYAIGGTVKELWDISTPPGAKVGNTGIQGGLDAGLDYHAGVMYSVSTDGLSTDLYTINPATGAGALVGSDAYNADSIAIDPTTGNGYAIDAATTNSLYKVDLATGKSMLVGKLSAAMWGVQGGAAFTPDGTLYFFTSTGQMFSVNTATGVAKHLYNVTVQGAALDNCEGLAIDSGGGPVCVTISFEVEPGPDGKLGTGDDVVINAPTSFAAQTKQLTTEFGSVWIAFDLFEPAEDKNEVLNAQNFTTPPAHTPPNILASANDRVIRMRFPSPASKVSALIGISDGADEMTAYDENGAVIMSVVGDDEVVTIDLHALKIFEVEIKATGASDTPAIDNLQFCFLTAPTYADCDGDKALNIFDFLCFQNQFTLGSAYADCDKDGKLTFFDLLCFQNLFIFGLK